MRLHRYIQAAQRSIQRHGGGLAGAWSVLRRAINVARAMGLKGLVGRLKSASAVRRPLTDAFDAPALPEPAPLDQITLRVGVMAHVYYADLIEEFAETLSQVPLPFTLLVSVVDDATAEQARQRFQALPNVQHLLVRQVENRGRDIAPLLVTFHEEIMALDLIGHIHTKKSLYTGNEQEQWRRYLLDRLYGSRQRLAWLLGMFQADPGLGMIYPESYAGMPLWGHTLLSNGPACDQLARRLGIALDPQRYLDFPAGSMFWARVSALRPLYELKLRQEDFPVEQGQVDGTLHHAVERMLAVVTRHGGYRLGILPADGTLSLATEGERNVAEALHEPLRDRLQMAAVDARLVTVDVFDTLVTRAFLTPAGAREHLAWRIQHRLGVADFSRQREDAESSLREQLGRDPTLDQIHQRLAERAHLPAGLESALVDAERAHEKALLQPRRGVLAALENAGVGPLTVLSDMYLAEQDMRAVLPAEVTQRIQRWWISCETGSRKDDRATWQRMAQREGRADGRWLHVGDNEHADVQLPQLAGLLAPVHVLRPSALLDVVPGLRPLRARQGSHAPWPEQLWRGLVANQFAAMADDTPQRLLGRPRLDARQLGYVALGPLLLDFLLATIAHARQHGVEHLLFLSREGYVLQPAFERLQQAHPGAAALRASYFLASRRATLLPSLQATEDAAALVQGTFNGTLRQLLVARLGTACMQAIQEASPALLERHVFLPDMREEAAAWLQPHLGTVMALAMEQREAYRAYWARIVGSDRAMVVDLGYAGSIQRNLARAMGHDVDGYYMALRQGATALAGHGTAQARYFDGRQQEDEANSAILQHDLLLESLLGAPQGQFNGFDAQGQPRFGPVELSAEGIDCLARVHEGALAFISDACNALGEDIAALVLDPDGVQAPLQCVGSGRWDATAPLSVLATEDAFTGRGTVNAAG